MAAVIKPLVSIVIPVYNGSNYLSQAISSALSQSYSHVEVLVVNDGSTDGGATALVALSYGSTIRYYEKDNGGVASALNFAIKKMNGSYFSWLSHDDVYHVDKIERQIEFLSKNDLGNIIVYSDYEVFEEADLSRGVPVRMPGVNSENFRYWITSCSMLHGCSLLIPREAFDKVGLFDTSLRTTQDYELWFRMASFFEFRYLPGIVVSARSHAQQDTRKLQSVVMLETTRLYADFVRRLSSDDVPAVPDLAGGYLKLAFLLWQRSFHDAALLAESSALASGASQYSIIRVRIFARLLMLARKLARGLMAPRTRQVLSVMSRRMFSRDRHQS